MQFIRAVTHIRLTDANTGKLAQLDALAEEPPVGLELCLAGTAQADTAFLAFQVGPAADEARGKVLELCELDLYLAFVAARALGEDVEDQAGTIHDAAIETLLEIALLYRRQLVIEDRDRRVRRGNGVRNFFDFAFSCKKRRIGPLAPPFDNGERAHASACSELLCFRQAFGVVGLTEIETDENRLTVTDRTIGNQEREISDINSLSFDRLESLRVVPGRR